MKPQIRTLSGVMAAALLAAGMSVATAQPGGMPHGAGGGGGFAIEQVIASLKGQLNLNTSQQATWDSVAAHGKAAREQGRAGMEQMHAALNAELAKPEPDFATLAALSDQRQAEAQAARKQVRDEWLALYATFSPAQKAVVRDAVKARVTRMEAFREKMKERFQSRNPA